MTPAKETTLTKILSKNFLAKLEEYIIDSGKLQFSRQEMIEELGCANFLAAHKLNKILRKLGIKSYAQLHQTDPHSLARIKGVGETVMYLVMCILDYNGYDVEVWWGWKKGNDVKFSTFKHHVVKHSKKYGHAA